MRRSAQQGARKTQTSAFLAAELLLSKKARNSGDVLPRIRLSIHGSAFGLALVVLFITARSIDLHRRTLPGKSLLCARLLRPSGRMDIDEAEGEDRRGNDRVELPRGLPAEGDHAVHDPGQIIRPRTDVVRDRHACFTVAFPDKTAFRSASVRNTMGQNAGVPGRLFFTRCRGDVSAEAAYCWFGSTICA